MPSTVAGVEALLSDEQDGYSSAAIASSVCELLFDGIQLLQKGVQDETCESHLFSCTVACRGRGSPSSFDVNFPSKFHEVLRPRAINRWMAPDSP